MLATLAVPILLAGVFTGGGCAILRVQRGADKVGGVLFCVFVICAVLTTGARLGQIMDRFPHDAARVIGQRSMP